MAPETPFGEASSWRIGETIPWVVPWSGEEDFDFRPSSVFAGLLELTQSERQGVGRPSPSGMNIMRQRRGVLEFRCHVCGEVTPAEDRYLFPVVTGGFLKIPGGTRYVSHLPPTHAGCAERAQRLCPHLRSRYAKPVEFPRDTGFVAPERGVPDTLRGIADRLRAPSPLVYGYYRVFGEGFTRVARRLRRTDAENRRPPLP